LIEGHGMAFSHIPGQFSSFSFMILRVGRSH
jgi:hypothetical protein